jgi:site-specific DNA recombinase
MYEMKRACVYTRVSTDAQGEDGKVSLPEQERMAKACIESKGWQYVRTYEDNGYTGRNTNRPALQTMLADVQKGDIDAIVIFKLDRLSRKQRDTLAIIEDVLLKNNVDLVSLRETLDTSTPWGRAMIGVLSSFNQLESENIAQRTAMGRYATAREGGYAGGKPPLGYQAIDGHLVIVPEEAEIVRLVFDLRAEGKTLMAITDELNRRGYRSKKGNEFKHSAIQTILNNEDTYRGNYKYGKESSENTHEPILG